MQTFKYRALAADGGVVSGVLEAYDEFEAVEELRRTYAVVEDLIPVKQKKKFNIDINEPLWVEDKTLSLVASQFSIMIKAGLPMSRVVELIANQSSDKLMRRILTACAADVAAGYSLSRSLEKNGKKIPAVFIESVRAGEESGTLEQSFDTLKAYYERAHKIRQKVKSALTYPIIVVILAFIVVGIVMVVLVPTMIQMFENMNTELPWPTRALIAISHFFSNYWALLIAIIAAAAIGLFAYSRTEKGKINLSKLRFKIPIIGRIATMNTAAQVANTISTLLGAGLPITRVIDIVSRVLDQRSVGVDMEKCVPKLETGNALGDVLRDVSNLPDMLVEMARIGEESGSLENTLHTIGEFYSDEAERASDRALRLIEPMITVILGIFVGFIVIAIYVPMFSMYQGAAM